MSKIIHIYHNDADTLQVERVDFVGRKVGNIKRTDEGYLTGDAPVAKIGILSYVLNDGSIRKELVTKDTLFNQDSMSTLKMKPVTDQHPPERLLDSRTVKRRKVGFTGENIKRDEEYLVTPLTITDEDAISNIDEKRKELSPGYRCDLLLEAGTFDCPGHPQHGQRYDGIQLNRKYNHLAVCDKARGGEDLKLHIDSIDNIDGFEVNEAIENKDSLTKEEIQSIKQIIKGKGNNMPQINIDGINYDVAHQEVINFANKETNRADSEKARADTAESKVIDTQKKVDTLEGERDGLKTKVDEFEKLDHTETINKGVTERIGLLDIANVVITNEDEKKKIDSMSNKDLKIAVIKVKSPDVNLDEKTDDYINARYDSIAEGIEFDPNAVGKQRGKTVQRNDSNPDPVEKARVDSEKRMQDNYKDFGGTIK